MRPQGSRVAGEGAEATLVAGAQVDHVDRPLDALVALPAIPEARVAEREVLGVNPFSLEHTNRAFVDVDNRSRRAGVLRAEVEPVRSWLLGAQGHRPRQLRSRRPALLAHALVVLVRNQNVSAALAVGQRVESELRRHPRFLDLVRDRCEELVHEHIAPSRSDEAERRGHERGRCRLAARRGFVTLQLSVRCISAPISARSRISRWSAEISFSASSSRFSRSSTCSRRCRSRPSATSSFLRVESSAASCADLGSMLAYRHDEALSVRP